MAQEVADALLECKVGFIGGGKMAQAMDIGSHGTRDNCRVVQECDIVFLCVKPYLLGKLLEEIKHVVTEKQLFVSVAAGVPLEFMEEALPKGSRIVRTIPNTPCLVQSGVIAYTPGGCCTSTDVKVVHHLLSSVASAENVPEPQIDIISSLCGSSVAWFYMMIEGASDGAVKVGLPRKLATELAARAMVGAGNMVLKTGKHPGELKDEVTSPAGSTIVGIHSLERDGMRGSFMSAVEAAFLRNKEMNPKSK
eukprot:gene17263-8826_t